jgi:hypothetical protein
MGTSFNCDCTPRVVCDKCRERARVRPYDVDNHKGPDPFVVKEKSWASIKAWGDWDDPVRINTDDFV